MYLASTIICPFFTKDQNNRANLYKKGKNLHIKIQDTVSHTNGSMVQIKKTRNIHAFVFYQSQIFKQNKAKEKPCHSKPHTTHQFEKNYHVSTSTSSQELQGSGFLFDSARTSIPQFFSRAARLVGLLLRTPWFKCK